MIRALSGLFLLAGIVGCQMISPPVPLSVHHEALKKPKVTAVNLLAEDGVYLRSSNQLSLQQQIPVGAPAEITRYTAKEVDILIQHVKYTMTPASGVFDDSDHGVENFLEKYFAAADAPIDLEKLGPADLATDVKIGRVVKGMTKQQVYVALGPPQWIGKPRQPTVRMSRDEILQGDRWVYTDLLMASMIPKTRTYIFTGGKLFDVE